MAGAISSSSGASRWQWGTPGYEELDHDATGGIVDLLLPGLLVFYLHDYIAIEYILHGESPLSDDAALVCAC